MKFIRENSALAAGIGLPFLLVIIFSLFNFATERMVEAPKHDLYFTISDTKCTNGNVKMIFYVAEDRIKAKYNYPKPQNNYVNCYDNQHLYRFDVKTMTSTKINFSIPPNQANNEDWHELDSNELKAVHIDSSVISPDGYKLEMRSGYYRGGGILPFYGSYDSRDGIAIIKNGRVVNISPLDNNYYINQATALGWVIAQ